MTKIIRPIYSDLLKQIYSGEVESLLLIPDRREVIVRFNNGNIITAPILRNDQQIIRAAADTGTILSVKDTKSEQALASMTSNLAVFLIVIIGISFLIKRSASIAKNTIGFGQTKARVNAQENIHITFEDVAGIDTVKNELIEIVNFLLNPDKLIKLGAKIPRGVLLIGPPGTGKTLLAKAIAGEAGVPFFSISASEFVELFVGVGASRVRDLFKKAKQKAPCIIFIDEIDAIGRQRGAGIGGGNDEREQTLNQLLTEMDGFTDNSGVILLAATNRSDILDSALTRPGRFDRRLFISLPDRKGRKEILSVHARSRPISSEVVLDDWATRTPGFTGAELENLINEAAIISARTNSKYLGNDQFEQALERITIGIQAKPLQDNSQKRLIAYHEIGHALIANLISFPDQVDKVTIIPRTNGIAGYTRYFPDDEILDSSLYTKKYLFSRLIVALGGRAAEIVVYGYNEVTQGSSGDLEVVGRIAREMVTKFGFSSIGPISLEDSSNDVFLGAGLIQSKNNYSNSTGKIIDQQVRLLALNAMNKAINLLTVNRHKLDKLSEALVEEETLTNKRFQALLEST